MEISKDVNQDEQKARLFYLWFANCQNREYLPINSRDRSCKTQTSNIFASLNKDALRVVNILRVYVCLPKFKTHSTETFYYENGDVERYFNLESIKNVMSQDVLQHVQFAYRNYIANPMGSTMTEAIEPATKRPRQANTAKVLYVRLGKDESSMKDITLNEDTAEVLVSKMKEKFRTEIQEKQFRIRVEKENRLFLVTEDASVAVLEKYSILQIDFIQE